MTNSWAREGLERIIRTTLAIGCGREAKRTRFRGGGSSCWINQFNNECCSRELLPDPHGSHRRVDLITCVLPGQSMEELLRAASPLDVVISVATGGVCSASWSQCCIPHCRSSAFPTHHSPRVIQSDRSSYSPLSHSPLSLSPSRPLLFSTHSRNCCPALPSFIDSSLLRG